jgi:microcystin-dependent protein
MQPVLSSHAAFVSATPTADAAGDDSSFVVSTPRDGVTRAESERLAVDYNSASATLVVTDKASGQEATYALPQFSGSPNAQSAEKFTVAFSDGASVSITLPQGDAPATSSTMVITSGGTSTVVDLPTHQTVTNQAAADLSGATGAMTASFERRLVEDALSRHRSKRQGAESVDEDDDAQSDQGAGAASLYATDAAKSPTASTSTASDDLDGEPVESTPGIDDTLLPPEEQESRARSWFLALAEVLGENLDRSIDKMVETIDAIDAGDDSATRLGVLAAETARFNYLGTTDAAIISTIGSANKSLSDRK